MERDYMVLEGDFTVSFEIPKIVQGNYTVHLQADFINALNAVVEVFIDGKPVGGSVDLTRGAEVLTLHARIPLDQRNWAQLISSNMRRIQLL